MCVIVSHADSCKETLSSFFFPLLISTHLSGCMETKPSVLVSGCGGWNLSGLYEEFYVSHVTVFFYL